MVVLILDAILHFLGTMKGEYLCVCDVGGGGGGAKYSGLTNSTMFQSIFLRGNVRRQAELYVYCAQWRNWS